jgi:hypothetical protein
VPEPDQRARPASARGKSDALDSERIARETLAHPELPRAFKRAGSDSGPNEVSELLSLWHKERRSVVKLRQQLLSEAESLLSALPDEVRDELPASKKVRTRLTAIGRRDRTRIHDPATALRLRLLDDHTETISRLDAREREATRALENLIEGTAPPWVICTGSRRAVWPSSWSRWATRAVSRRAALLASTAPRRSPHPPVRVKTIR